MASRKHYTDEFKREAVRLATTPGNSMAGVTRDLGVNRTLIGHWVKNAAYWLRRWPPAPISLPREIGVICCLWTAIGASPSSLREALERLGL